MADRREYNRQWYAAHREDQRRKKSLYWQRNKQRRKAYSFAWNLRVKFGLTPDQYQILLETQQGHCLICSKTKDDIGRNLSVDHDHKTGRIRGLLCDNCNVGLGHFFDSPSLLKRAADYLERQNG